MLHDPTFENLLSSLVNTAYEHKPMYIQYANVCNRIEELLNTAHAEGVLKERERWSRNIVTYVKTKNGNLLAYRCLLCEAKISKYGGDEELKHNALCLAYTEQEATE